MALLFCLFPAVQSWGPCLLCSCEAGRDLQCHRDPGALHTHSLVAATSPCEPFSSLVQRSRGMGRVGRGGGD